ncbi:hypothetical protein HYH02_014987 [Chlamydomonas schloesseri]|uniref:Major facilitator superfamily (MFS) profile domain-containing protein n=1 Tax=Chlamydomonas schloesseri TaxID=2026947 RepID=A0A835SLD2_9CHLO|nr:hypothetical protein HYH02_014987 [Chlamydomonas schloesseri]|eukprot:KAG2425613.1 hypothetical protein HYH02_014987 [Chlamydomonas schloesseri]
MGGTGGAVTEQVPWVDDALAAVGLGRCQVLLFFYVGLCWMSDAMEVMLVSVMAPAVACEWDISPESQSLLAGAVFLGMMLASPLWGALADVAGRRRAFGGAAALAAVGGVASAFSRSLAWLVAARLVVGCGLVGVLPMYSLMEEWLPKGSGSKGKVLVALQVWWSVGTAFESLLALALLNSHGWRALLAASVAPLAVVLALLPLVLESPHYLAAIGKREEAIRVLEAAAALNGTSAQLRRHWEDVQQRQENKGQEQAQLEQEQEQEPHPEPGAHPDGGSQSNSPGPQRIIRVQVAASSADRPEAPSGDRAIAASGAMPPKLGDLGREHAGTEEHSGSSAAGAHARQGGGLKWSWLRLAGPCGELGAVLCSLLSPQLRGRTWRLAVTWFASALSYYGVVMLVPLVAAGAALGGGGGGGSGGSGGGGGEGHAGNCLPWDAAAAAAAGDGLGSSSSSSSGRHLVLPTSAYWSMMVAAAAELPSLALAFLTVDRWSRRRLVSYGLAATAAALAPLAASAIAFRSDGSGGRTASPPPAQPSMPPPGQTQLSTAAFVLSVGGGGGGVQAGAGRADGGSVTGALPFTRRRLPFTAAASTASASPTTSATAVAVATWLPLASVTAARLFVSGAFTLLYVLTPGCYPAGVRGSALGAANTLARVGAMAAPYVAVALPAHGQLAAALGMMAGACLAGAFAAGGLSDDLV